MAMHPLRNTKSVPAYLAALPPKERAALQKIRRAILAAAPGVEERVSYGIPGFFQQGPLLFIAAHSKHLSLHGVNPRLRQEFPVELAKFKVSGSTVHFSPEHPVPLALVKKIVKRRLDANHQRVMAKLEAKALRKRSL